MAHMPCAPTWPLRPAASGAFLAGVLLTLSLSSQQLQQGHYCMNSIFKVLPSDIEKDSQA